jgi:hypothetical protein
MMQAATFVNVVAEGPVLPARVAGPARPAVGGGNGPARPRIGRLVVGLVLAIVAAAVFVAIAAPEPREACSGAPASARAQAPQESPQSPEVGQGQGGDPCLRST